MTGPRSAETPGAGDTQAAEDATVRRPGEGPHRFPGTEVEPFYSSACVYGCGARLADATSFPARDRVDYSGPTTAYGDRRGVGTCPNNPVSSTASPSVPVPDLDTIRQRADKATPGPWQKRRVDVGDRSTVIIDVLEAPESTVMHLSGGFGNPRRADAEFIAHARTDIPALIAALVAVEAERDTLAAKIEAVTAAHDRECHYNRAACPIRRALSVVPGEREREE